MRHTLMWPKWARVRALGDARYPAVSIACFELGGHWSHHRRDEFKGLRCHP